MMNFNRERGTRIMQYQLRTWENSQHLLQAE